MKTATFTSLFAAAAIVGGLAMMVPADAGSKHKKNGSCNWTGCSTQWDTSHKQVNLDLRLRAIVVYQNCNGQACAGGATTGYATAYANESEAGATAGGSTDSYAGAGGGGINSSSISVGGLQVGYNDSDSNNSGSATATNGATARASSRQESTSVAGSFGGGFSR